MTRVLFVDNDPSGFEVLKGSANFNSHQWELFFAPHADAALLQLTANSFDVIVSDVRNPGTDGAALLKKVCERFPGVVRIALSAQSEIASALRAVPVAHQFLVKPCDADTLRVAIERATSLSNLLHSEVLAKIVGSVRDLPVLPRTYLDLREAVAKPNYSMKQIVSIVEQDVSVSAKILQLVNSALFGRAKHISSVHMAVCALGSEVLQNLVLSAEVFCVFEKAKSLKGFSFEDLHIHSQLTSRIAARIPCAAHVRDAATVAGLLHDIGKLVVATHWPEHFSRALAASRETKMPLWLEERELMGVSHAEIGSYLLGLWGMPSLMIEAVALHHDPMSIPHNGLDAVGIVHIANELAHQNPVYPLADAPLPRRGIDERFLQSLGITDQIDAWKEIAKSAANSLRSAASVAR